MPRRKILSDDEVFLLIRRLLTEGGDKAVSFGSVSRATGLAPATLAQRYATREGMVQAALCAGWDRLDQACARAEAAAPTGGKGAAALLKTLAAETGNDVDLSLLAADFRDPTLRARAAEWRGRVENALALRVGGGAKGRETAAILFAAWIGQLLWQGAGGKGFRLKDAVKRLG